MKEIRIGLVGSGWMGKAHSSALADAEMLFGPDYGTASFEIVADANEEAAKSAQKKIGFKRISTDWHDVVTDPNVDLVDIATPNAFHYVVAKAALENGKNVYCEKPLSISAEESRELAELAAEKGVVNYVGFNNTQNPANAYVRELVQSGALGKIMRFTGTYDQDQLLDESLPDHLAPHQQAGWLRCSGRPRFPPAVHLSVHHGRHHQGKRSCYHRIPEASEVRRLHRDG